MVSASGAVGYSSTSYYGLSVTGSYIERVSMARKNISAAAAGATTTSTAAADDDNDDDDDLVLHVYNYRNGAFAQSCIYRSSASATADNRSCSRIRP
uniref:Uncharacterized protein n=1 Tax=Trichogramma kaykai TaxID=54128 RepID=A0ABD2WCE8_9HYME